MKFFLLASSAFCMLLAQDCSLSSGKWNLDYEFEEYQTPDVLNIVDEFVFNSHFSINITVCDEDYYYYGDDEEMVEYEYELEDDFLWKLRFELYETWEPSITSCRNCTIYKTIKDFRNCMAGVRQNMKTTVEDTWENDIWEHLLQIKEKQEACLEEVTTLPPTTEIPTTTLLPDEL